MDDGTYNIKGLPLPKNVDDRTKNIPYVLNIPVRYEISALANSKDPDLRKQWTLFVLALDKFKQKPVEHKFSYFQIACIHGYPETSWDHAPDPRKDPTEKPGPGEPPFGGYCNHNGLNFPTWHRPYMLLFERCIWENMKPVIDHWTSKHGLADEQKWRDAADQWRMPYWDWARQQVYTQDFAYPKVLTQGSVRIYPPTEVAEYYPDSGYYPNPLWGFDNPERDELGDSKPFGSMLDEKKKWNIPDNPATHSPHPPNGGCVDDQWYPWSRATGISRYGIFLTKDGTDFRGLDGVNNPWEANNQLAAVHVVRDTDPNTGDAIGNPGNLAGSVNRMFSENYDSTWGEFASTKWSREERTDSETGYMSLELIHNYVHNAVGGQYYKTGIGQMTDPSVSSFDPIFWLHHVQVDRLLAIWQCLYPGRWWDKPEPTKREINAVQNYPDDQPDDPLQPFHTKDNGDPEKDVYTANRCRKWNELNYQYDDLMALSKDAIFSDGNLDEELYKKNLRNYINGTYPSTASLVKEVQKDHKAPKGLTPTDPKMAKKTTAWNDYIINVIYDRYALNGRSYAIEFYLGGPKNEKETRVKRENYVGQVYNFGGGVRSAKCSNCKKQSDAGILSCGQIPLTIQLLHHALDKSKDHPINDFTKIEKYLELHLLWRYIGPGGVLVSPYRFPKTQITVLRGVGQLGAAQPVPVLPPPSRLKVGEQTRWLGAPVTQTEQPQALPAVYGNYEILYDVTRGKDGLGITEYESKLSEHAGKYFFVLSIWLKLRQFLRL